MHARSGTEWLNYRTAAPSPSTKQFSSRHGDVVPAEAVVELAVVGEDAGGCDADDGVAEVGEGGGIVSESR